MQAQLDATVASGDNASANLWRRALAAVRGEAPPNGLAPLTGADARALATDHAGKGDIGLVSLWAEIARVIGDGATPLSPAEPAVTIAAGASPVTEGSDATFTLSADRAPAADLTVTLAVSETGDHVAAETEGAATAVIARGETQAAFSVATVDDEADEPDGTVTVTVTLEAGEGYTVASSQGAATVTVSDDDAAAGPMLSVADATATEGDGASLMWFAVRLSPGAEKAARTSVGLVEQQTIFARMKNARREVLI